MRATLCVLVAAVAALVSQGGLAQKADWRVFGFTDKDMELYSVPDLTRLPGASVRVWTEGLSLKAMSDAYAKSVKDRALIDKVAGRVVKNYIPPYALIVPDIKIPEMVDLTTSEELANERKVTPDLMILWLIDCTAKRYRYLSVVKYERGRVKGQSPAGPWSYSIPNTNGANLVKLICDPSLTAPDNTPLTDRKPAKGPTPAPSKSSAGRKR